MKSDLKVKLEKGESSPPGEKPGRPDEKPAKPKNDKAKEPPKGDTPS